MGYFFVCLVIVFVCFSVSDSSSIDNNPGSLSIHENYDGTHNMWTISATCYVRYTTTYKCYTKGYRSCNFLGLDTCSYSKSKTCYRHAYTNVPCNQFYINSDPSGNFQMSGSTVQKKQCTSSYCGPTCNADGCLNSGKSHTIGVTAYRTGYETNGTVSGSLTVNVYAANPPTFYYSSGSSINVSHDSAVVGTVINIVVPSYIDNGNDYDRIYYRQNSGPGNSYKHGTPDLFYLDTSTGQVKVGKDLTMEFSYYFNMNLCVYDRRHREVCHDLNITLWACFQTPTCYDQSDYNIIDTYGTYTGHGGSSNTIFNMNYPQPTEHFPAFSSVWHDLTWTFDSNEFPEAAINSDTGEIYITRNISIWPSWPTQDYNQVARVANSESCYSTTCNFKVRIHFTNWPIEIRSLPTTVYIHEDYDLEMKIHSLVTFDYNYHLEDNVTCQIVDWFPRENNMFELRHDGNHEYDSFSLYKLKCQDPDCGYKYQQPRPYYCDTDIGCLTYNRTKEYTLTIQCWDGYNSTDVQNLTFRVVKNAVPAYINLPSQIELNRQNLSYVDTIFEIMYTDAENESLFYEYTYQDIDTKVDPGYFLGTSRGNYYNQPGNITMTTYLWDKEVNKTYRIHVCGHERRNEICEYLIVKDFKIAPEITNLPDSKSFPEDTPVGATLFTAAISNPGVGESTRVTVSVDPDSEQSVFNLDTLNGILTLGQFLDYERVNSYMFTFSVRDDYLDGTTEKTLIVAVTNVNEGNSISAATTTISFTEDTTTGTELSDPGLSCTDIDGDTTQYAIQSGLYTDYFSIDNKNGHITLLQVWDLEESNTTLPLSTSLIISCTDPGGLSSTTAITVNVEDVNDQAPVLLIDAGFSQPIAINGSTNLNTDLMTFSASDSDFSDDNNFDFEIMSEKVGAEYFKIVKSGPATAILRMKKSADFTNDQVFSITINVSDGETMPLFDWETISVIFTAGLHDANKSKPTDCFTCTTTGKTLFVVFIIVGVSIGLFILPIIYICCRFKSDSARHTLPNMENQSIEDQSIQRFSGQSITGSELSEERESSAIEMSQIGRTCIDKGRSEESKIYSIIMSSDSDR